MYENPRTDSLQIHKLSFTVDNLFCEYYNAWYIPILISEAKGGLEDKRTESPAEARMNVQVFSITLPYLVEDLYVQSKLTITFSNILNISLPFKESSQIQLEGSFNRFFNVFTPKDEELNAFTILAPNIMIKMIMSGSNYDFEFVNNKVFFYFISNNQQSDTIGMSKVEYDTMLNFGHDTARQLARAGRPTKRSQEANVAMWQLFEPAKIANSYIKKMTLIFFAASIPLLWPLGLYFVIRYFLSRTALVRLRQELLSDPSIHVNIKTK